MPRLRILSSIAAGFRHIGVFGAIELAILICTLGSAFVVDASVLHQSPKLHDRILVFTKIMKMGSFLSLFIENVRVAVLIHRRYGTRLGRSIYWNYAGLTFLGVAAGILALVLRIELRSIGSSQTLISHFVLDLLTVLPILLFVIGNLISIYREAVAADSPELRKELMSYLWILDLPMFLSLSFVIGIGYHLGGYSSVPNEATIFVAGSVTFLVLFSVFASRGLRYLLHLDKPPAV